MFSGQDRSVLKISILNMTFNLTSKKWDYRDGVADSDSDRSNRKYLIENKYEISKRVLAFDAPDSYSFRTGDPVSTKIFNWSIIGTRVDHQVDSDFFLLLISICSDGDRRDVRMDPGHYKSGRSRIRDSHHLCKNRSR